MRYCLIDNMDILVITYKNNRYFILLNNWENPKYFMLAFPTLFLFGIEGHFITSNNEKKPKIIL